MERLTEKHYKENAGYYMKCSENCHIYCGEKSYCEEVDNIVDRLGAIEEILGDDYDLDRLRELMDADRAGRCVVLPCKIGDTVYVHDIDGDVAEENLYGVVTCTVNGLIWNNDQTQIRCCESGTYIWSLGKDVFTTREAAEAALKRERHE